MVGGHAILYSVQASLIPELFGTRLRYTGASLGYQLAAPFAGGLAPMLLGAQRFAGAPASSRSRYCRVTLGRCSRSQSAIACSSFNISRHRLAVC